MRGYCEGDKSQFGPDMSAMLSRAASESSWLVDHGYPRDGVISYVGNRYQLSARQRLLLARAVAGTKAACARRATLLSSENVKGRDVFVDGLNAIITLEVALSGGPVIACQDGSMRDLCGLRGTYHPIDETARAIDCLLAYFSSCGLARAHFLVDEPVSNSGRLRALIEKRAAHKDVICADAVLAEDVDKALSKRACVVTSDSAIIDSCRSWINADAAIIAKIPNAWVVRLNFDVI